MKRILLGALISLSLLAWGQAANTILIGTDPIEETGGPDGWDGVAVMTTPIAGPPGESLGIVSTFNFYADPGRVDPAGLLTPLIVKESGGSFTIAGVGQQIEVTEGGIQSVPFNLVEGEDTVDLSGGDNFHIAVAQERVDGADNAAGGVIPFAPAGGKGMFYFDTLPPFEPKVGEEVSAGHESAADGRLYQFNFELEFSDDDPNALLRRTVDLGQIPSIGAQDFSIDIRNSGDSNPLLVESVTVSGGPQAASFSVADFTPSVEPRGTGTISMQIDTGGETGLFQATIEVKTNDATPEDQLVSVAISASVLNLAGPASHLPLDEAAGSVDVTDITGFNRHATLNAFEGSAVFGQAGLTAETGTALEVAAGGGIGIAGSRFEESLSEFAIAMWVKPTALNPTTGEPFGTILGMGTDNSLFGLLTTDGQLLWFGEEGEVFRTEGAAISAGAVHHVVMTRSAARASIWVDGIEVASLDDPPAVGDTTDGTLYFGSFNGALGFDGVFDDVQVYARTIQTEDIAYLHANPGKTLPPDDQCLDSDLDGLCDEVEVDLGTEPLKADTDGDGLSDGAEVNEYQTDPLSADSDGDAYTDGREVADGTDPNDAGDPGVPPPVRAGDPNEPLVARESVDGWSSVMVIDEARPFNLSGAASAVVKDFEFWVGAAVGRVTPFIAERTADNVFVVKAIGTTRVVDVDYSADDQDTAVRFPFDDNNAAIEVQDGWVPGFTVADPDGENNGGAVIPFDGGGGDMWLTGGPAPEESAAIAVGEAPNTEGTNTVFNDSLGRLYAFAITAQISGDDSGLLGYWKFDGDATDASGNGHDGTLTNGAAIGDDIPPGSSGQSLQISGGEQHVLVPHSDGLNITEAMTITAWVKPVGDMAWDGVIAKNPSDGSNPNHAGNYELRIENGTRGIHFLYQNGGDNDTVFHLSEAAVITGDTWSHVAVTAEKGGVVHYYINGQLVDTHADPVRDTFGAPNSNPLYIGSRADLFTAMDGFLDDVALFDRVLSADEIGAVMEWNRTGGGDDPRTGLGAVAISEGPLTAPAFVDFGELSGDATYEFSFNALKDGASTAITGNDVWAIKLDQWNEQGLFGTTQFGVADNVFTAVDGQSAASVFGTDVHVVVVNDTAGGETRLYANGVHVGTWAGNFELAGEVNLMAARIAAPVDAMGAGSVMYGWATYNSALAAGDIATLVSAPFPAGMPPTEPFVLGNVGINAGGAFNVTIPDGVTADIEYSTDLINWEVIATGLTGTVEETDAARLAAPSGYYRAK